MEESEHVFLSGEGAEDFAVLKDLKLLKTIVLLLIED